MTAAILTCTCHHPYQDTKYGPKKRVHNWSPKKAAFRCTVCKTERSK